MGIIKGLLGLFFVAAPLPSYNVYIPELRLPPEYNVSTSTYPDVAEEATTTATTTAKKLPDNPFCSCVKTARRNGLKISGDAKDLIANGTLAEGNGVLFRYPDKKNPKKTIDHVAVILEVKTDSFVVIESNFKPCQLGQREVQVNDKFIRGFLKRE